MKCSGTAGFVWVALAISALFGIFAAFRSCERAEDARRKEALNEEIRETSRRYAGERIHRDVRILNLELIKESAILIQVQHQNRGRNDATWWQKFDNRRARVDAMLRDTEQAGERYRYERITETQAELKKVRELLESYKKEPPLD